MYLEIANRHMKDFYNMELVAPFDGKRWPRPYKMSVSH